MSGKRVAKSITGNIDPSWTRHGGRCTARPRIDKRVHRAKVLAPGGGREIPRAPELQAPMGAFRRRVIEYCSTPARMIIGREVLGDVARNLAKHGQVAGDY